MEEANSQPDTRLRIALVEDDETLAMLLSYNLQAADLAVDWYADGREAVSGICVNPPSLVILDWMLPQLSGIEILRRIRRHPATCDLPVLMLTARSEPSDRARAMALGVDVFLAKPFSVGELISSIGPLLLRRPRPDPGSLAACKGSSA
jgi:two-component system phosphate regulon response regulator PhoB